jgi:hypothetical protein
MFHRIATAITAGTFVFFALIGFASAQAIGANVNLGPHGNVRGASFSYHQGGQRYAVPPPLRHTCGPNDMVVGNRCVRAVGYYQPLPNVSTVAVWQEQYRDRGRIASRPVYFYEERVASAYWAHEERRRSSRTIITTTTTSTTAGRVSGSGFPIGSTSATAGMSDAQAIERARQLYGTR